MPSPSNQRRADRAAAIFQHYHELVYGPGKGEVWKEYDVSDLLADIMHYCHQNTVVAGPEASVIAAFDDLARTGRMHFNEELALEQEEDDVDRP